MATPPKRVAKPKQTDAEKKAAAEARAAERKSGAAFKRLAVRRTNAAIKQVALLSNLAPYPRADGQAEAAIAALRKAVDEAEARFAGTKRTDNAFSL